MRYTEGFRIQGFVSVDDRVHPGITTIREQSSCWVRQVTCDFQFQVVLSASVWRNQLQYLSRIVRYSEYKKLGIPYPSGYSDNALDFVYLARFLCKGLESCTT